MKIFGVVGWKNNGKTTLVERLVSEITERGVSVSTVKHAHHGFDIDQPGKDSYRHRAAGAREVLVSSGTRWALLHELRGDAEPELEDLLPRLDAVDLVIVEGFKRDRHDKLEVHRAETGRDLIAPSDPTIQLVASDEPLSGLAQPVLDINDVKGIADFILAHTGLASTKRTEPA